MAIKLNQYASKINPPNKLKNYNIHEFYHLLSNPKILTHDLEVVTIRWYLN